MLAAIDVHKTYGNGFPALRGVSLSLEPGRWVGLSGESGSGKSTLARVLCCLEPLGRGRVELEGRPYAAPRSPSRFSPALGEFRRRVQIVFQDTAGSLDPRLPLWRTVAEPLENFDWSFRRGSPREQFRRVGELLERVGLPPEKGRSYPHELSGGQRQRGLIARALAVGPRYLLCDEPVSSLDGESRGQILELLVSLGRETSMGGLFISHDPALCRRMGAQWYLMEGGKLREAPQDTPGEAAGPPRGRESPPQPGGAPLLIRPPGGAGTPGRTQPCLSVRELSIAFPLPGGLYTPVRGFSVDLKPQEILGLAGPSGSGKSLICAALMGMLEAPGRIQGGSIRYIPRGAASAGEGAPPALDLGSLGEREWRSLRGRELSLIFQNPAQALNPSRTLGSQFIEAFAAHEPRGLRKTWVPRARALLAEAGLGDTRRILGSYPFELSGGMAQRALIAIALAHNPAVLIADEPTTALDKENEGRILSLFQRIRETFHTAILLVSHDQGLLRSVTDRQVFLGGAGESGKPKTSG